MSGPDSPSSTQAPPSHPIPDNPLGEHIRNHHPVTFGRGVGAAPEEWLESAIESSVWGVAPLRY